MGPWLENAALTYRRACRQTPGAYCPLPAKQIRRGGRPCRAHPQAGQDSPGHQGAHGRPARPMVVPFLAKGTGRPRRGPPQILGPLRPCWPPSAGRRALQGGLSGGFARMAQPPGGGRHAAERPRADVAGFPPFSRVPTDGLWQTRTPPCQVRQALPTPFSWQTWTNGAAFQTRGLFDSICEGWRYSSGQAATGQFRTLSA
jgi:hypothetical protein